MAALAVLLQLVGNDNQWENEIVGTVQQGQAIEKIETSSVPFMCVWPKSERTGDRFWMCRQDPGTGIDAKAIIGQVNMQQWGTQSVQGSIEVMKLAWFIGKRVSSGELTLPVDAYFVSSRKAQNDATMTALCHAFEVAMSGVITEEDAREDAAFREGVEISRSALDTLSTC
jgi:hypothetical protein